MTTFHVGIRDDPDDSNELHYHKHVQCSSLNTPFLEPCTILKQKPVSTDSVVQYKLCNLLQLSLSISCFLTHLFPLRGQDSVR